MKRIGFLTDLHLDFANPSRISLLQEEIQGMDYLLIAGDIVNGFVHSSSLLDNLLSGFNGETNFVLGNHDYYGSSFMDTDEWLKGCYDTAPIRYIGGCAWINMGGGTRLIGVNGFYDALYVSPARAEIVMPDFTRIGDLRWFDKWYAMKQRAMTEAARLWVNIGEELYNDPAERVVILTHVPPFRESAWYDGAQSTEGFLPFFTNKSLGDELLHIAEAHPETLFTVLCGHTHGSGYYAAKPNLEVYTGGAEYGNPRVSLVFELNELNNEFKFVGGYDYSHIKGLTRGSD